MIDEAQLASTQYLQILFPQPPQIPSFQKLIIYWKMFPQLLTCLSRQNFQSSQCVSFCCSSLRWWNKNGSILINLFKNQVIISVLLASSSMAGYWYQLWFTYMCLFGESSELLSKSYKTNLHGTTNIDNYVNEKTPTPTSQSKRIKSDSYRVKVMNSPSCCWVLSVAFASSDQSIAFWHSLPVLDSFKSLCNRIFVKRFRITNFRTSLITA